jgi:hypothetical protein
VKPIKRFHDGIGFRHWHYFAPQLGTAIRWHRYSPGLFGILLRDGYLHVGCWWGVAFSLCAVHPELFGRSLRHHQQDRRAD